MTTEPVDTARAREPERDGSSQPEKRVSAGDVECAHRSATELAILFRALRASAFSASRGDAIPETFHAVEPALLVQVRVRRRRIAGESRLELLQHNSLGGETNRRLDRNAAQQIAGMVKPGTDFTPLPRRRNSLPVCAPRARRSRFRRRASAPSVRTERRLGEAGSGSQWWSSPSLRWPIVFRARAPDVEIAGQFGLASPWLKGYASPPSTPVDPDRQRALGMHRALRCGNAARIRHDLAGAAAMRTACWIRRCRSCMRTRPWPRQVEQVDVWPSAEPPPSQVSHSTRVGTSICFSMPNTASLEDRARSGNAGRNCAGTTAPPPPPMPKMSPEYRQKIPLTSFPGIAAAYAAVSTLRAARVVGRACSDRIGRRTPPLASFELSSLRIVRQRSGGTIARRRNDFFSSAIRRVRSTPSTVVATLPDLFAISRFISKDDCLAFRERLILASPAMIATNNKASVIS